jgi:Mn2+ and Fe2+ transporters of the NRAMP family
MLLITVSLSVVQEMCARLGAVTGRGLLDLIRERFRRRLGGLCGRSDPDRQRWPDC